jgi:hypothetical protein
MHCSGGVATGFLRPVGEVVPDRIFFAANSHEEMRPAHFGQDHAQQSGFGEASVAERSCGGEHCVEATANGSSSACQVSLLAWVNGFGRPSVVVVSYDAG